MRSTVGVAGPPWEVSSSGSLPGRPGVLARFRRERAGPQHRRTPGKSRPDAHVPDGFVEVVPAGDIRRAERELYLGRRAAAGPSA
ncbi:hypothetical protein ACFQ3Z_39235 [Streptomyces nogalater]